jgi:hypothetical protein
MRSSGLGASTSFIRSLTSLKRASFSAIRSSIPQSLLLGHLDITAVVNDSLSISHQVPGQHHMPVDNLMQVLELDRRRRHGREAAFVGALAQKGTSCSGTTWSSTSSARRWFARLKSS